uniref:Uncharacterized protein n=1 Tax=Anguilla anguilla TaxID=7936 RepID=A0A0E9TAH8_ANGAN
MLSLKELLIFCYLA